MALLGRIDRGVLMAKLDLQAAFHMVPILPLRRNLGPRLTPTYTSAYDLPLASSMSLPVPSIGSWSTTMEPPSCTTWMTSSCLVQMDCPPVRTPCPPCCVSARSWACGLCWRWVCWCVSRMTRPSMGLLEVELLVCVQDD